MQNMLDILYDLKIFFELYIVPVQDIGFSMEYTNASGDKTVSLHNDSLLLTFHFLNRFWSVKAFSTLLFCKANCIFACFLPLLLFFLFLIFLLHFLYLCWGIFGYSTADLTLPALWVWPSEWMLWLPIIDVSSPQVWLTLKFCILLGSLYRVTSARVWLETTNWFGTIPIQLFLRRWGLLCSLWLKLECH